MGKLKKMGKQKSPSGIPPGGFCFPTVRYTLNNRIFISQWFITVIPENGHFQFSESILEAKNQLNLSENSFLI